MTPAPRRQLPGAKTAGATSLAALVAWLGGECWTRLGRIEETVRAVEIRQAEEGSRRDELKRLQAEVEELKKATRLNASKAIYLRNLIEKEKKQ